MKRTLPIGLATVAAIALLPGIADAHTATIDVSCQGGINVTLVNYSGTDHVTIWKDSNVIADTDFTGSYDFHRGFTRTEPHTWRVKVSAGNENSPDQSGTVEACVESTTTTAVSPTTTTQPTTTTMPVPTTTAVVVPTTVATPTTVASATTVPTVRRTPGSTVPRTLPTPTTVAAPAPTTLPTPTTTPLTPTPPLPVTGRGDGLLMVATLLVLAGCVLLFGRWLTKLRRHNSTCTCGQETFPGGVNTSRYLDNENTLHRFDGQPCYKVQEATSATVYDDLGS